MAYPWFSIIALALIAVLAIVAVGASLAVWRIRSLAVPYRGGLVTVIMVVALAGIGWVYFVAPVYFD
jgi:hypothetical protein